ncbi:hypothetical protein [Kingella oralis]|uniref:hypothetical protein n=1 Tax=Kingella oralis TaxID=505 RepID=UPI002D7FAFF5|nr:hypothetical protein [Kingella oralis]
MNKFIYHNQSKVMRINDITVPANLLTEGVLLAKQHHATLTLGYNHSCEAGVTETNLLMRQPAAVYFAPLALYPELEKLWINELPWETTEIKNVEQLYAMPKLKYLSIWDKQMPLLDVSRISALESLQANPAAPKHIINIGKAAGLQSVSLYSYKGKDLTEFTSLKNLTSIDLINPAIGSLNGLEQMPQLERLELMDTRNLKDVSLIGELLTQNRPPKNIHGGRLCCKPICWFERWAQRAS